MQKTAHATKVAEVVQKHSMCYIVQDNYTSPNQTRFYAVAPGWITRIHDKYTVAIFRVKPKTPQLKLV